MCLEGARQMPRTVMIAVHDPNIRYLLQRYAEESGFQTVSATRGRDQLATLIQQPDLALVILDAELPGISGQRTSHRLKAEAALRNIPVVIYSSVDELIEEWDAGVAAYLPKSILYDDFVAALKRAGVCWEPAW